MNVLCLKFPNKETAHSFLYDDEGEPIYPNIADHNRTGLPVHRVMADEGEYLTYPQDGSYCADIAGLNETPAEIEPYVITPNPLYRKHKFLGE